ncbi:MAG: aldo/keto reductase, partial [Myxococcales bacterium]|nr:aldo/keto reductase [Myxococcales bacterium]
HFEKMLYDNSQLVTVYLEGYQATGNSDYLRVARETLDYVLREMTSEEGGFYSATDADSEGVEGKFFVWTPDEVNAILPPDQARAFCAHYDVTPEGNWEGHSILHTPRAMAEVATDLGISEETLAERLAAARRKIYAARLERVPPLLDDKILCAWNALMISALAEAGRILDEPRYREAAERAADFLWQRMRRPDGGLFRTTRAGKTHLDAYLEDYAYLCDALIDTYEATGEPRHLQRAKGLADRLIEDFHDEEAGGFFSTAKGHEALLVRTREGQDGALPSPNAVAAMALLRLSHHLDDAAWRALATGAIEAYGKLIDRAPRAFCASLAVIDGLLEGPVEAVLVGDAEGRAPFARALGKIYLPNRILVHLDPAVGSDAPEALVSGKTLVEGKAALYLCRNFACERPLTEPAAVRAMLELDRERAEAHRKRRLRERRAGRATQLGTARYVRRFVDRFPEGYGKLGKSELSVARLGFGGYRVDDGDPTFRKALVAALEGGANLIDTSSNYTGGGSERLVGSVLGELLDGGVIQRDEIVVVSKLGYAQGDNLALARARAAAGRPFPEMVEHDEACWHCIHPEWLDDQLERSLERLGLVTLDVCLLHNPEYFFAAAAREGAVDEAVRDRFYDRVERAFAWLEEQVAEGRIGAYGVSSNTVAQDPKEDPQATELPRFLQAARAAGGNGHHFRVLQLPLNLIESQAALPHEGDGATLLARAEDAGLAVLINRPLNAIGERGLERLVDPPEVEAASTSYAEALARLAALEASFQRDLAPSLDDATVPPNALFRLAPALENLGESLHGLAQWEQLARGEVIPLVSRSLKLVETAIGTEARNRWTEWRGAYIRQTELTLSALRASTARREAARATRISDAIDPHLPLARQGATLAQKALLTLVSTPGIHVTLLGMRRPSYVREALEVLRWPRFEGVSKVFEAAASCSKA